MVVAYKRVLFCFAFVPCILSESQEKLWAFSLDESIYRGPVDSGGLGGFLNNGQE